MSSAAIIAIKKKYRKKVDNKVCNVIAEVIIELLNIDSNDEINVLLFNETNIEVMKKYLKVAAKSNDVNIFLENIKLPHSK